MLFSSYSSAGIRCDLLKKLDHPDVYSNSHFWEDYAQLSSQKKLNDKSLEEIFKKHNIKLDEQKELNPGKNLGIREGSLILSTSKKVDKEVLSLSQSLRKNYEEFLGIMTEKSGVKKLYENPGKWHMEKMHTKDTYTVRLNRGVRVLFKIEKNELSIMEVDAAKVHAF